MFIPHVYIPALLCGVQCSYDSIAWHLKMAKDKVFKDVLIGSVGLQNCMTTLKQETIIYQCICVEMSDCGVLPPSGFSSTLH